MKYGEMIETVDRIGCALRKRGFRASDTVLFIANNQLETAISYLAVWAIEGCPASLGLDSFTGMYSIISFVLSYIILILLMRELYITYR